MALSKESVRRTYAPDYVSAETLAYRLDCSRSTIDDYVRRGLLPPATNVGNLQRWRWSDVEAWIDTRGGFGTDGGSIGGDDNEDAYLAGVKRVSAT